MSKIDEIGGLMAQSALLYDQWAKRQGISYNVLAVFYSVAGAENCTQKRIAESWALPKQTVFSVCKQLKEKGLLSFEQESGDRREKILHLTERGRAVAEPIVSKLKDIERTIAARFGEKETEQFINQLQRFNRIIAHTTQE